MTNNYRRSRVRLTYRYVQINQKMIIFSLSDIHATRHHSNQTQRQTDRNRKFESDSESEESVGFKRKTKGLEFGGEERRRNKFKFGLCCVFEITFFLFVLCYVLFYLCNLTEKKNGRQPMIDSQLENGAQKLPAAWVGHQVITLSFFLLSFFISILISISVYFIL